MLRLIALAATAALLAAPASAESIRIPVAGKTYAQLRAEVTKAATTLCANEIASAPAEVGAQAACVEHTVRATFAHAPQLGVTLAQR
ncbi:MAG: hypothetical protein E7812_10840 [Phenylobacterium sp.]|nr:MAG: hypothetical protein E7812_10840 [Phenylobacterium sp.]